MEGVIGERCGRVAASISVLGHLTTPPPGTAAAISPEKYKPLPAIITSPLSSAIQLPCSASQLLRKRQQQNTGLLVWAVSRDVSDWI